LSTTIRPPIADFLRRSQQDCVARETKFSPVGSSSSGDFAFAPSGVLAKRSSPVQVMVLFAGG
jgi:hypothetical protein